MILALDTSSEACSAAVWTPNGCFSRFELTPKAHTQLILPMIEQVLLEANVTLQQIEAIAFGCGPGAFTGVRIATGVAQGLALAADKRLIPVSTLAAMAQQAYQTQQAEQVLVALDARMGEVYWGSYGLIDGRMQPLMAECVIAPNDAPLPPAVASSWVGVGNGWRQYEALLMPRFVNYLTDIQTDCLPNATYVAQLAVYAYQQGELIDPALVEPVYLRNKVALTTLERTALKP
ncbi:tRNA (adenosine(37)-N6)-threonylcarbamoyltransferase complex dimerization subunit type 1 TsaB [Thiofilum flexile]|uniref:tRNA (adenosine(37)-N6)-threonylcarbamoyltransferase complex dimerization subunit type 1 TsaB n=1 Tax=Thiofilum flexile TaxID=125627 RepID=UPI000362ECBD|nr:tRNA (adenosine(37)-N6)-threonylcarbamoyltransferase complex dimerization subunit type 1 TsaB [Thiofilum flexile]